MANSDLVTIKFHFTSTEGDITSGVRQERDAARKNFASLIKRLKFTRLIKVVSKREYAELTKNGKLRFGSVNSYRAMDDKDKERGDPDEGAVLRGPGHNFRIFPGLHLTELTEIVDFSVHSNDVLENIFLYCTYSVDFREVFRCGVCRLPATLSKFGAYAIGFHALEFVSLAVKSCQEKNIPFEYDFVDYVKDNYHGPWGPFRKRIKYAHQREFRFAIRAEPSSPDPDKKDEHFFTMDPFREAFLLEMKHGFVRLFYPCSECNSKITGILAPDRRRPKRMRRKIANRYGALHHYQRCVGCGEEFRLVGKGEQREFRKRRSHQR